MEHSDDSSVLSTDPGKSTNNVQSDEQAKKRPKLDDDSAAGEDVEVMDTDTNKPESNESVEEDDGELPYQNKQDYTHLLSKLDLPTRDAMKHKPERSVNQDQKWSDSVDIHYKNHSSCNDVTRLMNLGFKFKYHCGMFDNSFNRSRDDKQPAQIFTRSLVMYKTAEDGTEDFYDTRDLKKPVKYPPGALHLQTPLWATRSITRDASDLIKVSDNPPKFDETGSLKFELKLDNSKVYENPDLYPSAHKFLNMVGPGLGNNVVTDYARHWEKINHVFMPDTIIEVEKAVYATTKNTIESVFSSACSDGEWVHMYEIPATFPSNESENEGDTEKYAVFDKFNLKEPEEQPFNVIYGVDTDEKKTTYGEIAKIIESFKPQAKQEYLFGLAKGEEEFTKTIDMLVSTMKKQLKTSSKKESLTSRIKVLEKCSFNKSHHELIKPWFDMLFRAHLFNCLMMEYHPKTKTHTLLVSDLNIIRQPFFSPRSAKSLNGGHDKDPWPRQYSNKKYKFLVARSPEDLKGFDRNIEASDKKYKMLPSNVQGKFIVDSFINLYHGDEKNLVDLNCPKITDMTGQRPIPLTAFPALFKFDGLFTISFMALSNVGLLRKNTMVKQPLKISAIRIWNNGERSDTNEDYSKSMALFV